MTQTKSNKKQYIDWRYKRTTLCLENENVIVDRDVDRDKFYRLNQSYTAKINDVTVEKKFEFNRCQSAGIRARVKARIDDYYYYCTLYDFDDKEEIYVDLFYMLDTRNNETVEAVEGLPWKDFRATTRNAAILAFLERAKQHHREKKEAS